MRFGIQTITTKRETIMPRPSYTTVIVLVVVAALSAFIPVDAWSAVTTSSFGGTALSPARTVQNGATMEMKKGKPNVPVQMRGQYKRQQEMAAMQREIVAASKPSDDGLPVFNLFVRTKKQNVSFSVYFLGGAGGCLVKEHMGASSKCDV